jgi:dTDP-4-dehydrorhamnose reductase
MTILQTSRLKVLLTGATGLLGRNLAPALSTHFSCASVGFSQYSEQENWLYCDLTDSSAAENLVKETAPDIVIHTVALTDVDQCEREPAHAHRINVTTTKNLVAALNRFHPDCKMVYISTDQVYDGPGEHREDKPAPPNVYGLTKLWAEDITRTLENYLVLRTNFFAPAIPGRQGFAGWLIDSLAAKKPITMFTDVYFNPIIASDVAEVIIKLLEADSRGTLNLGATDSMSKAEFAHKLADIFGFETSQIGFGSVTLRNFNAKRPNDMRMSTAGIEAILGEELPTIESGLLKLHASSAGH